MKWLLELSRISVGNEAWDEYRKSRALRADLNVEVDFGVINGAIGAIVTKWDFILFGKWIVFIYNIIYFFDTFHVNLIFAEVSNVRCCFQNSQHLTHITINDAEGRQLRGFKTTIPKHHFFFIFLVN